MQIFIGNLVNTPSLRFSPKGTPWASSRIAIRAVEGAGELENPVFADLVAFQGNAKALATFEKGNLVQVDGCLETRKWISKDGTTRRGLRIIAEGIGRLTPAKTNDVPIAEALKFMSEGDRHDDDVAS